MKLCRFELKASPGEARSGMVHAGRIYETDGHSAIAVHEAVAIRPLSPIPHAPTVRIFHSQLQGEILTGADAEEPQFFFANPTNLGGASQVVAFPDWAVEVSVFPAVAIALVGDVHRIDVLDADDAILGYTLMLYVIARDAERRERRLGAIGRSFDIGGVLGPVLTTPEELEAEVEGDEFGRRFGLQAVLRVNGVERGRGSMSELPFTFAQAISSASQSAVLKAGDLFALGPVVQPDDAVVLEPGDGVQLAVDQLGTLAVNLASL